jgi:hypothetical protein
MIFSQLETKHLTKMPIFSENLNNIRKFHIYYMCAISLFEPKCLLVVNRVSTLFTFRLFGKNSSEMS